jgi:hypothetical protein
MSDEFRDELGMKDTPAELDDGRPGIIVGVRRVGENGRQQTRVVVKTEDGEHVDEASERVEVLR